MDAQQQATVEQAEVLAESAKNEVTVLLNHHPVTVEVYKCKVKQIGKVLSFISGLLSDLGYLNINDPEAMKGLEERTNDPSFLLQLIANYSDKIMEIGSLLCSLDQEQFEELELDDAVKVLTKEWEVNQSFFSQQILPLLGLSGGVE